MSPPLISIVIPTYNSAAHLSDGLTSVAEQGFRDFEVVIIDGGSTDHTVSLAEVYRERLPELTIFCGPDAGIYDAINKGIDAAKGIWVLVLGSDDRLAGATVLADVSQHLASTRADLVYGDVRMVGGRDPNKWGRRHRGKTDLVTLTSRNICQQAIFYRRNLFREFGGFDLRYEVWADWHFNIKVAANKPTEWLDLVVSDYSLDGFSTGSTDERFRADLPMFLANLVARTPFNHRLPALRWLLLKQARMKREGGMCKDAVCLWFVALWLAVLHKSRTLF